MTGTMRFEDRPSGRLYLRQHGTGWRELLGESAYGWGYEMGWRDASAGLSSAQPTMAEWGLRAEYIDGYVDGFHDAAPF